MRKAAFRTLPVLLAVAAVAACSTGPDYRRPQLDLPAAWQDGAAAAGKTPADWWKVFNDPSLNALVDEALKHNRDLAAAAARIDEARATLTVTDADRWPSVYGTANTARTRVTQRGATPLFAGVPVESSTNRITLAASYEADFWGKYSRASEAARADLLRSEAARDAVRLSLVADVVSGYYTLVSLEGQEKAAQRTYATRDELAGLQAKRFTAGVASELEVHTTGAEREAAHVQQVAITRARAVEDARLAVLLGRSPRDVWQKRLAGESPDKAFAQSMPPAIPEGLPSDLLERRPDVREAEQRLIAANARIGVAKSAYFPSITLTGFLGTESAALAGLFTGPAGVFQLATALTQPIWGAGRVGAQVEAATARQREALANYEKAIQNAFADVRVALAAHQAARETFDAQTRRSAALGQAYKLARLRYDNGIASLLEVLDAERNLLAADLSRLDALAQQRTAVADLIKALGGGWADGKDAAGRS